ncbi:MAG TPA: helix-turn-helix transcriptional regulator [Candidatus Aphodovivens excrementavium]|nr:helix-turn-helix transcriptional regulator [Candidatus Aphodovivens excrementavium]
MGISVQTIGLRIRALREERDISLRKFALMTGLNKSHLSAIERGRLDMRISSFGKILDGLGVSAEEFFKGLD